MTRGEKLESRPNLSVLALVSFIGSFALARAFTTLNPESVVLQSGLHFHHFWYGIVMLAVGGWLGISYSDDRVDRIAAIIYGAGGGLIADEVGILLTFESRNYWAGISYTFVIILVTIASTLTLLNRYSSTIKKELAEFTSRNAGLYFGVCLLIFSVILLANVTGATDVFNYALLASSVVLIIIACTLIFAHVLQRVLLRLQKSRKSLHW